MIVLLVHLYGVRVLTFERSGGTLLLQRGYLGCFTHQSSLVSTGVVSVWENFCEEATIFTTKAAQEHADRRTYLILQ
jgi:hypothetical protein